MRRLSAILLSKTALIGAAALAIVAGSGAMMRYPAARETLSRTAKQIQSGAINAYLIVIVAGVLGGVFMYFVIGAFAATP